MYIIQVTNINIIEASRRRKDVLLTVSQSIDIEAEFVLRSNSDLNGGHLWTEWFVVNEITLMV